MKDKFNPKATQDERDLYTRYVAYFDSGTSPYSGPAPLPFFMWMKLKPQHRPGGPAVAAAQPVRPSREAHMSWNEGDITWVVRPEEV